MLLMSIKKKENFQKENLNKCHIHKDFRIFGLKEKLQILLREEARPAINLREITKILQVELVLLKATFLHSVIFIKKT